MTDPTREREDSLSQLSKEEREDTEAGLRDLREGRTYSLRCHHAPPNTQLVCHECLVKDCDRWYEIGKKESTASIVKAAYEGAAQVAGEMDYSSDDAIGKAIRASIPESALLGAQIAELEARLEEVNNLGKGELDGTHWIGCERSHRFCRRKLDLESQIAATKAEMAQGTTK